MDNLNETLNVVFKHHTESVQNNRVAMTLIKFLGDRIQILEKIFSLKSSLNTTDILSTITANSTQQVPDLSELNKILKSHYENIESNNPDSISDIVQESIDFIEKNEEDEIQKIKQKFDLLNSVQKEGITKYLREQNTTQEDELQVAQTVMDIMKDLVINHNNTQKYFETTES